MFADANNDVYWEQISRENLAAKCVKMAKFLVKLIGAKLL